MEQLTILTLLSFSMLIGSYFAGTIPIAFTFSEEKIRQLTIFGSGILVGTALSVIIPEGVNSIYETGHESHVTLKPAISSVSLSSARTPVEPKEQPHSLIGLTLVLGFVFMLLIDQIASRHSSSYSNLLTTDSVENGSTGNHSHHSSSSKITATIGLVVHAAADGVALGAAATTSHTDVEMIVFFAIMLHKAPAAFGLVTFLIHEGLDRHKLKRHLIAFSLSAPIAAFLTYFTLGQAAHETLASYNATGLAMLFSAGTFLYVSTVHVLPEITQQKPLKLFELVILVCGSMLPSVLTLGHHH